MTLNETLREMKAASRSRIPPESAAIMSRATDNLVKSGLVRMALEAGGTAPGFSLPDAQGQIYDSAQLLSRGPIILSFYRGSW